MMTDQLEIFPTMLLIESSVLIAFFIAFKNTPPRSEAY